MMRLLLLFVLVSLVYCESEHVKVFTSANFDEGVKEADLTLVEFYAPWCGHCKALAPEYDAAAKTMFDNDSKGKLAKVDCTTERELCSKYGVRGFPTLKLFRKDVDEPSEYQSGRTAKDIVSWMKKQSMPAVSDVGSKDDLDKLKDGEPIVIVLFAAEKSNEFAKVAEQLRNDYTFGWVSSADVAKELGAEVGSVTMYRDFDNEVSTNDLKDLERWVKVNSFPLIGTIGPENYKKYLDRGFNFLWIFYDLANEAQKNMIENFIKPVAKAFGDKLSFVKLDGVKWAEHAKSFGLSDGTPGIAIEDREARKNYVFPKIAADAADFAEKIKQWVSDYVEGKLQPTVKSEPIPEKNDEPVTVIVGKTFEDIVMDETKDVLVEFYAPWCGHCKSLAPKYEVVGQNFEGDSSTIIAKIDATANDSPADIQGFPTLLFYGASSASKKSPKTYSGDRSAEAITSWVKENKEAKATEEAASGDEKKHDEL